MDIFNTLEKHFISKLNRDLTNYDTNIVLQYLNTNTVPENISYVPIVEKCLNDLWLVMMSLNTDNLEGNFAEELDLVEFNEAPKWEIIIPRSKGKDLDKRPNLIKVFNSFDEANKWLKEQIKTKPDDFKRVPVRMYDPLGNREVLIKESNTLEFNPLFDNIKATVAVRKKTAKQLTEKGREKKVSARSKRNKQLIQNALELGGRDDDRLTYDQQLERQIDILKGDLDDDEVINIGERIARLTRRNQVLNELDAIPPAQKERLFKNRSLFFSNYIDQRTNALSKAFQDKVDNGGWSKDKKEANLKRAKGILLETNQSFKDPKNREAKLRERLSDYFGKERAQLERRKQQIRDNLLRPPTGIVRGVIRDDKIALEMDNLLEKKPGEFTIAALRKLYQRNLNRDDITPRTEKVLRELLESLGNEDKQNKILQNHKDYHSNKITEDSVERYIITEINAALNINTILNNPDSKYVKWDVNYEHYRRGKVCFVCFERSAGGYLNLGIYPRDIVFENLELIIPKHPYCLCRYIPLKNDDPDVVAIEALSDEEREGYEQSFNNWKHLSSNWSTLANVAKNTALIALSVAGLYIAARKFRNVTTPVADKLNKGIGRRTKQTVQAPRKVPNLMDDLFPITEDIPIGTPPPDARLQGTKLAKLLEGRPLPDEQGGALVPINIPPRETPTPLPELQKLWRESTAQVELVARQAEDQPRIVRNALQLDLPTPRPSTPPSRVTELNLSPPERDLRYRVVNYVKGNLPYQIKSLNRKVEKELSQDISQLGARGVETKKKTLLKLIGELETEEFNLIRQINLLDTNSNASKSIFGESNSLMSIPANQRRDAINSVVGDVARSKDSELSRLISNRNKLRDKIQELNTAQVKRDSSKNFSFIDDKDLSLTDSTGAVLFGYEKELNKLGLRDQTDNQARSFLQNLNPQQRIKKVNNLSSINDEINITNGYLKSLQDEITSADVELLAGTALEEIPNQRIRKILFQRTTPITRAKSYLVELEKKRSELTAVPQAGTFTAKSRALLAESLLLADNLPPRSTSMYLNDRGLSFLTSGKTLNATTTIDNMLELTELLKANKYLSDKQIRAKVYALVNEKPQLNVSNLLKTYDSWNLNSSTLKSLRSEVNSLNNRVLQLNTALDNKQIPANQITRFVKVRDKLQARALQYDHTVSKLERLQQDMSNLRLKGGYLNKEVLNSELGVPSIGLRRTSKRQKLTALTQQIKDIEVRLQDINLDEAERNRLRKLISELSIERSATRMAEFKSSYLRFIGATPFSQVILSPDR